MLFHKFRKIKLFRNWKKSIVFSTNYSSHVTTNLLMKYLDISEIKSLYLFKKYADIKDVNKTILEELLTVVNGLGLPRKILLEEPLLLTMCPIKIKYRYNVLFECGIMNVTSNHLIKFPKLIKQPIKDLKQSHIIPAHIDLKTRLLSYMTECPNSTHALSFLPSDIDNTTLYAIRFKIMQNFFKLIYRINEDEFSKYTCSIQYHPLKALKELQMILETEFNISHHNIKSHFGLLSADPENLKKIIDNLKTIGDVDIKTILLKYPRLATTHYLKIIENKKLLDEYGVSEQAQINQIQYYKLKTNIIQKRLEAVKAIPEMQAFSGHHQFLKLISSKRAILRLFQFFSNNKRCFSLNFLLQKNENYDSLNDKCGDGSDIVICISNHLGKEFNRKDIRKMLHRHNYWLHVPILRVMTVLEKLTSLGFSNTDIFENCPIVLYDWQHIEVFLRCFNENENREQILNSLDLSQLNNSQKLSLCLYLLEKQYYLTGHGVLSKRQENYRSLIDDIYL